MRVWLAEKSSFAKELAEVLGNPKKIPGYAHGFDTDGGRVLYAKGHLVSLAEPHSYDEKYNIWDVADLPILPNPFILQVLPDSMRWYECIEKGIVGASEVVVATDAGREGEYIAWLILKQLGYKGPRKRLWTSGSNQASIRKALSSLLPYSEKEMYAIAAQIRAESDWVEGINLTRIFSKKFAPENYDKPLSVGRVQTAVLTLIVRRAHEIETFKASAYFEIEAFVDVAGHQVLMAFRPPAEKHITDMKIAQDMAIAARNQSAPISVVKQSQAQKPPKLFQSSTLQIRAHSLWGWTAAQTEVVTQALYDTHKLITYPRTDGVHLEDNQVADVPAILANLAVLPFAGTTDLKNGKKFVDLSAHIPSQPLIRDDVFSSKRLAASGADHHGIIPTTESAVGVMLSPDETKLYMLIARQYLAQMLPDCRYEQLTMTWNVADIPFTATGRTVTDVGWRVLFDDLDEQAEKNEGPDVDQDKIQNLPEIANGSTGQAVKVQAVQKITRAPKWFTEGSILGAMQNLSTIIKDEESRALLQNAGSIGTKSTWGATIEKLKERLYIFAAGGALKPTQLGQSLVAFCDQNVPQLTDPVTTARLEQMLQMVEKREMLPAQARGVLLPRNINAIRVCLELPEQKLKGPLKPLAGKKPPPKGKPRR